MQAMKRIEVLLPEALVQPFTDLVEKEQFQTYTVSGGLFGRNKQGAATAGLSDAAITIICTVDEAGPILMMVEQFIARYGGVGTVIDAHGFIGRH